MLKINMGGGAPPAPPAPPDAPPPDQPDAPPAGLKDQISSVSQPAVLNDEGGGQGGQLPKAVVVYMTSEFGPFRCDNCCYFQPDGSCQVVEGDIDPGGCCNLFCPPNHDAEPDAQDPNAAEEAPEGNTPGDTEEVNSPMKEGY